MWILCLKARLLLDNICSYVPDGGSIVISVLIVAVPLLTGNVASLLCALYTYVSTEFGVDCGGVVALLVMSFTLMFREFCAHPRGRTLCAVINVHQGVYIYA